MFLVFLLPLTFAIGTGQVQPLFPSQVESLIPADVLMKMKAVHENPILPPQVKHEQIDKLMLSLPTTILDKIPPPPGFENLPKEVQDTIRKLSRDGTVKWVDRQMAVRRYIDSLPEKIKSLIPRPGVLPPGFDAIPREQQVQTQMIENEKDLSFRDKYFRIKQIMDSLPHAIRSQLPAAPPPPPF